MKKYIYYTPIDLARAILTILPEIEIESIIDICCGSWNLLKAGKERFPNAFITGVDVDKTSEEYKFVNANFKIMDGREFAQSEYKMGKTYDLILSNPPFGPISDNERKYGLQGNLEGFYSQLLNKRYECEMMQANMLLAHEGSYLLFILPYTFIAGDSYQKARCQLAKDYSVFAIIKLPITTFDRGRINTFAIILQKKTNIISSNVTTVYEAINEDMWKFEKLEELQFEEIQRGNWWFKKGIKRESTINIVRGNISSCSFVDEGKTIFHCAAKKDGNWLPSVRYYCESKRAIKANKGDVIINRIGKAAGYWCVNKKNNVTISDCLLLLRNASKEMLEILEKNSDNNGRLSVPLHGVTTLYITAEDVKALF